MYEMCYLSNIKTFPFIGHTQKGVSFLYAPPSIYISQDLHLGLYCQWPSEAFSGK